MSHFARVLGIILCVAAAGCSKGQPAVSALLINPHNPQIIYAGSSAHVSKSRDGGETWELSDEGMSSARVMSLGIDPPPGSQVYAGTFGDAIWKSWDGGHHWQPDNRGLKEHVSLVTAIAFDPETPTTMYIGTTVGPYKRTDPDDFWLERVAGMLSVYVVTLVADPMHPGTLYAGTSGGMYKSVDRAEHWVEINEGLGIDPTHGALSHGVNIVALKPDDTATLYIGTTRGLFVSANGGQHWEQIRSIPAGPIAAIVFDPKQPATIYAGGTGVFKSADGGKTWTSVSNGLTKTVRALAIDPQQSAVIYAGTNGGVFKTTDGGGQWTLKPLPG